MRSLFHLAFHVTDLNQARRFYGDVLGCSESTVSWHLHEARKRLRTILGREVA